MSLRVDEASPEEIGILRNLAELYAYDFSEMLRIELNAAGRFDHDFFKKTWGGGQTPYLLRVEGHLAGFAILGEGSRITLDPSVNDVVEFFVVRRYRRAGIGSLAAADLFRRRSGKWEVRQRAENEGARAFWRKAIAEVTGGRFEEVWMDDARWRGWVQRFVLPEPSSAAPG